MTYEPAHPFNGAGLAKATEVLKPHLPENPK
jgi:hypothetical protein